MSHELPTDPAVAEGATSHEVMGSEQIALATQKINENVHQLAQTIIENSPYKGRILFSPADFDSSSEAAMAQFTSVFQEELAACEQQGEDAVEQFYSQTIGPNNLLRYDSQIIMRAIDAAVSCYDLKLEEFHQLAAEGNADHDLSNIFTQVKDEVRPIIVKTIQETIVGKFW